MYHYFAPMEGITGYVFRNAHSACFGGVDKYFSPFLSPNAHHKFSHREFEDIRPDHNRSLTLVPQLLTNRAEDFIWAAEDLYAMGYEEINLNLGCPSMTVVAKGKGSGFLAQPQALDAFLDQVFASTRAKISVKTRLGKSQTDEFPCLMEIFNRYPIHELIIHPRLQTDYYKNAPHLSRFEVALSSLRAPVGYNGDLFSAQKLKDFALAHPGLNSVMLGRGLLAAPGMLSPHLDERRLRAALRAFHDQILEGYLETVSGERNALCKMKELWLYMIFAFEDAAKPAKRIKKAARLSDYQGAVNELFENKPLSPAPEFCPPR